MEITIKPYEEAIKFHGHNCPGLAIGYRASEIAMKELLSGRSEDEELVCIAENDACSVDGVQYITGCTMGKGNLIFRDYGKQVYTFILRDSSDAVRIVLKDTSSMDKIDPKAMKARANVFAGTATPEEKAAFDRARLKLIDIYLTSPAEEIFEVKHVKPDIPERARIFSSVECSSCGETVSESRARVQDGKIVCIPCYNEYLGINR
ncbi:FmdE family protein [Methanoplanus limicola]|uniref:Formylmethanofuran dehydrogenase, subunit E n=1 Tax=Methanoplanus limicola DSM 2279 TaxID=937775 RepID=H1Z1W8_9EURY|nr:FmdE family protein [Methanoplanus limicola]EHQ35435.1 formylmethanofuran dehydrogenase, subunit E [Methanoplanus limicola DSM 2279]